MFLNSLLLSFKKFNMDIMIKIVSYQIRQKTFNFNSTLVIFGTGQKNLRTLDLTIRSKNIPPLPALKLYIYKRLK